MLKYKIYEMASTSFEERTQNFSIIPRFIVEESDINDSGCGFDSLDEALLRIKSVGNNCTNYTVLPYIYLTD